MQITASARTSKRTPFSESSIVFFNNSIGKIRKLDVTQDDFFCSKLVILLEKKCDRGLGLYLSRTLGEKPQAMQRSYLELHFSPGNLHQEFYLNPEGRKKGKLDRHGNDYTLWFFLFDVAGNILGGFQLDVTKINHNIESKGPTKEFYRTKYGLIIEQVGFNMKSFYVKSSQNDVIDNEFQSIPKKYALPPSPTLECFSKDDFENLVSKISIETQLEEMKNLESYQKNNNINEVQITQIKNCEAVEIDEEDLENISDLISSDILDPLNYYTGIDETSTVGFSIESDNSYSRSAFGTPVGNETNIMQPFDEAPTDLFSDIVYNSSPLFSSTQPNKSPFSFGSMTTPTNSIFGANAPQGISTDPVSGLLSYGNSNSSLSFGNSKSAFTPDSFSRSAFGTPVDNGTNIMQTFVEAPTALFSDIAYNSSPLFSSTQPDRSPFSFGSMTTPTNSIFGKESSLAANAPQGISTDPVSGLLNYGNSSQFW